MSFLSHLFGEKEKGVEELLESLQKAQKSKDFVKVAKLYYQLGEFYYQQGNKEKAWLYLNRFDNLSGSRDDIYGKIPEKQMDQASDWIGELEESDLYLNELMNWTEEEAEGLDVIQKAKWNLLTLARFEKLFLQLSKLPGFELLSNYGRIVEILAQAIYSPIGEAEYGEVLKFVQAFYPFTDSEAMADVSNRIVIEGGADFEAYDLQGGCTLLNMYTLMDDILQYAEQRRDMGDIGTDLLSNVLLADYYIRTHEEPLREIPAVQAEVNRIRKDLEFVKSNPVRETFMEQMKQHGKLMIPVNEISGNSLAE